MKKIASFEVDHTKLPIGMYISRADGDIVTYDIRMAVPNSGEYLETPAMHTIEHLFATYARNSAYGENVVYVGPMGCRTGFYLIVRGIPDETAIRLVRDSMEFIASFEGRIPGATEKECGNFLEHDLPGAKESVLPILHKLQDYDKTKLQYDC